MEIRITFILLALAVVSFGAGPALADNPYFVEDQLIVRIDKKEAQYGTRSYVFSRADLANAEVLVPELNLYLVKTRDRGYAALMKTGKEMTRQQGVLYVQPDYKVRRRAGPNDPDFAKQWSLNGKSTAGIHALEAWDLLAKVRQTRARSQNDVVIAVVDAGVDLTHPDLKENIWVNAGEVAGNNKDDDGNGFVDDVYGWNAYEDNGNVKSDMHGTHVAGIVGARGNNKQLVAGVNWETKFMAISGSSGSTSVISKAYGYVLKQKKLWLETKGEKGANIVVTNSSFGVDGANCKDDAYRVWNDLYNAMGEVGILSAVATANASVDVDTQGDVPSGCDSPFIISVTNTTEDDQKNPRAGYGLTSIDLGAPGTAIRSTVPGNQAQELTGTSMATPHVAGAVGFLHALGGPNLEKLAGRSPSKIALWMKELVLRTVDKSKALEGKTVTGGRLNLYQAARVLVDKVF
jgi:subtilisin family serine protease